MMEMFVEQPQASPGSAKNVLLSQSSKTLTVLGWVLLSYRLVKPSLFVDKNGTIIDVSL